MSLLPAPYLAQPFLDFAMLRVRHEEIYDVHIVPHKPLILVPPPALVYEPALTLAPEESPELEESVLEQQNALEDQPEPVDQHELKHGIGLQAPIFLVMNEPQSNMNLDLIELEELEVQVIPVFPWGLLIVPQPDLDWPIDDMEDQFLDPELEVID